MTKTDLEQYLAANPDLREERARLETLHPGTWVLHRSWGLGQITGYLSAESKVVIDFENNRTGHAMDPRFCLAKLEILPPRSIVVRQRQNPAEIEAMIKGAPNDLIAEILRDAPSRQLSSTDLEKTLGRLLGENRFKKWWANTKKLLVRDGRIEVPARKTDPWVLREEPVKAEDEVLEEFYSTKNPKKKIALAEKLLNLAVAHDDIKEALPEVLRTLTVAVQDAKALNPGERLHGVWVRNDLARGLHEDVDQLVPTSASIITAKGADLSELARQVPATYQKRFLEVVVRNFPDGWEGLLFDLLKNSEGKFTNECVNYLFDRKEAQEIEVQLVRWLDEMALRESVIRWMLKNRSSRKYGKMLASLMNPRLLQAIFNAVDNEALQNATNKRIPLADQILDDAEIIQELLAQATLETARDLATTLMLNQGFEDLDKKSLMARFIKLFPSLQSLVAGDAPASTATDRLVVSKDSYEARKREYDELVTVKIPENKEAIAIAREHGDLRENAEYKMARQDQDTLMARKAQLERDLARAQTTDFTDAPTDVVGIGSFIRVRQGSTGDEIDYGILGAWDGNPEKNILSYQTPLGRSLLSKQVGDRVSVEVGGHREEWTLLAIRRWNERQRN